MKRVLTPADRWQFITLVDEFERELHNQGINAILSTFQLELRAEPLAPGRVLEFVMRARFPDSGTMYLEYAYSYRSFSPMLFKMSKKEIQLSLLAFRHSLQAQKALDTMTEETADLLSEIYARGGIIPLKDHEEAWIARIDPNNTDYYKLTDDQEVLNLITGGMADVKRRLGARVLELNDVGLVAGRKLAQRAILPLP